MIQSRKTDSLRRAVLSVMGCASAAFALSVAAINHKELLRSGTACVTCHAGMAASKAVAKKERPVRLVSFSHELHLKMGKKCVDCHRGLEESVALAKANYPKMIELFSSAPMEIEVQPGQHVIPIPADEHLSSLSAILMDPDYYGFIMGQRDMVDGLPLIKPAGLIVLKVRAWLDLTLRRTQGDTKVKDDDVNKHRSDVFRLASILPVGEQLALTPKIVGDLRTFMTTFSAESPEWPAIRQSLENSGIHMMPTELLGIMTTYFQVKD